MTPRARIKSTLNFKIPDRIGIYDCFWDETRQMWQQQNLVPTGQPYQYFFNFDLWLFEFDQSFLLKEKELQAESEPDADAAIINVNSFGVTERKWRQKSGASEVLDIPVKTEQNWQDFKLLLTPCKTRIKSSFELEYKTAKEAGLFLTLAILDPFQHAVSIFGLQNLLGLLNENPGLINDVFSTSTDLSIQMHELLSKEGFIFDGVWFWADLAYKNACYFSCAVYKNLLFGFHKKLCSYFRSKNMPVIFHSDGNLLEFLPLLLKAGIRALNPLEIDCGFDLEFLKKEYSKDLVLFGNMPTDVLEKDTNEIEKVFSRRLDLAKKGSGFIYHSDKPIPPAVSFKNYKFALGMVKKYGTY